MNLLQEYKCPCCGGAIEFDMETLQGYDDALKTEQPDDMQWKTAAGGEWQQGETENLRSYVCKSCGGADSPRPIKLRQRGSDGKWFLWEQYLLTGVRTPKPSDPWA